MSRAEIKAILENLGVKPSKDFGQNFLINPFVVSEIVDFAVPEDNEQLVEIGPGLGALTAELVHFKSLTLIEIEKNFCKYLKKLFPAVNILNEDVRFVDFADFSKGTNNLVVFGNLPYSFSSQIIFHLLEFSCSIKRAILMLQKEFAERLAAVPSTKAYGALSVITQLKAEAVLGPIFPGDCFYPRAAVDSQVIELRFFKEPKYEIKDDLFLKQLIQAAFSKRRKKLVNTLTKLDLSSENILDSLSSLGISKDARAEELSVEEFVALAKIIY